MARWIHNIFNDLQLPLTNLIRILQDNQSTIKLIDKGYGQFGRTKHVQKRFFSIKDLIIQRIAILVYLRTELMLADLLTKSVPYQLHSKFSKAIMLGLVDVTDLISKGSVGYIMLNKTKDARSQVDRIWAIKNHLLVSKGKNDDKI